MPSACQSLLFLWFFNEKFSDPAPSHNPLFKFWGLSPIWPLPHFLLSWVTDLIHPIRSHIHVNFGLKPDRKIWCVGPEPWACRKCPLRHGSRICYHSGQCRWLTYFAFRLRACLWLSRGVGKGMWWNRHCRRHSGYRIPSLRQHGVRSA